jgi:hypothetical protein
MPDFIAFRRTCACRKSNPNILVMQPAQDWKAKNTPVCAENLIRVDDVTESPMLVE